MAKKWFLQQLRAAAALGVLGVTLSACDTVSAGGCRLPERRLVSETLYFGTAKPGTEEIVSSDDWNQFIGTVVTPRFPEGFTAWSASGQWKPATGEIVQETSHVLTLLHSDAPRSDTAVRDIVNAYKKQFNQEAVLRVRSLSCVSF